MRDRVRVQRRRARARDEQRASLPGLAGATERPSSATVGGQTGVIDTIVTQATQANAAPNALLDSKATADLVQGTIAQVVERAAEQTPRGHRFSDIDVFAREPVDEETDAAEPEDEQETATDAEAEAVDAFAENATRMSAPRGGIAGATSPTPPPDAGGDGSSKGAASSESVAVQSEAPARAAKPSDALVEAVGGASAIEVDVDSAEADDRSANKEVDAGIEAAAEEIGAAASEAGVDIEGESVDIEAVEITGVEDLTHAERGEGDDVVAPEREEAGEGGGAEEGGAAGGGRAGGKGGGKGGGGKGKGGGRAGGGASGAAGGKGGGGGGGAGGGAGRAGGRTAAAESAAGAAAGGRDLPSLSTGSVALIDEELVEHQRWAGARGSVGEAGSLDRAAFVVDTAGGAALSGLASGAAMGLGIGLATRALNFIPGLGPTIGGVMALHGLSQKFENWEQTSATISRFGEGNSTYEVLANSIASVAEVVDIVSQVLNAINGVVGVLTMICYGITAAGAIATVATLGAAAPVLAAAAEISAVLTEIGAAITAVTTVLDVISAAVLQPAVLLFRAMHTFTSEADPREVEASGGQIAQAAAAWGGTLGAKAGGALADVGSGSGGHADDENSATTRAAGDADANAAPPAGGGAGAAGPDGPTVQFEAPAGAAGAVDVNAPTHVDSPAAHADTVPMPAVGGGAVDVNAPTHVDSPAAHADTVPMAVPEPGVSPMATTGEMPAAGAVDPLGRTQVDPLGQTQVDPLGRTQVDPLGQTQVDPLGQTQVDPLGQTQPGTPAGVGPPRNPVMEMTAVNPADVYPGAPQPPGFRAGPVGSLGSPDVPTSGAPPAAPLPGQRTPVMEMTPVNPADVYPGAPQPPHFQAGPVGSLDLPPATPMPSTLPQTHFDVPAAHAPTNLDIPAAHAPTNLDVPAAHAPTQPVDVVPAGSGTLPGIGPAAAAPDVEPIPARTGQTLPGIGPEPTTTVPPSGGGAGGGSSEPPSSGSGGSGGGSGRPNPLANASDADIDAALNAPGHSDLMLSAPAPAAPTRFSDASEAEIETAIDRGIRQAERRGTVDGQPANLSDDYRNLTPAEQAALVTDPGTVRPGPAPDQPGPGGSRYNISNGMMVNEVTTRSQSGRPGDTGDVPTVIRVHTADPDPSLPATSNSATGNTVTVTQGNQGARGQGVRMVPSVDADGNPAQTWHPTATASDDVMNASHIPIHRDPATGGGSVPPQTGGTLPGIGPPPNGGVPPAGGGGAGSPAAAAAPAREPSVIVDEAALGLPPGSVVTTPPTTPRAAPTGPQTDVDWSQMRVEYDLDPAGNITGSRLMYDHDGKSYPVDFNPQVSSFDPAAPPGPGPFAGTVGMPNYRHAPTTLADGTVVHHPPEFKPEARIDTTSATGGSGARVGPGGAWMDHTFPTSPEADSYVRTVAQGDAATGAPATPEGEIRDRSALPVGWAPDKSGTVWPGNPVDNMNVFPLPPNMPMISSVVAPQPEGDPRAGAGRVYPGGGPQVQIPRGVVHPGSAPASSYPIQRSGFPPPHGGAFTPVPPGHPAGSSTPRTPTGAGPAPAARPAASLGSTTRVASDAARANAVAPPGGTPTAEPSTAEQVGQMFLPQVFGPEAGPQPTQEQRQAAHNAHFTGDNQAPEGVERVNPAYPEPPGTPQQLEQIQTEISNLLAARARTEQAEQRMAGQEAKHRAGEAPIQQAIDDTASGMSASQAHQQSVARRTAANQEQQSRQQQGAGLVSGYPSRAAGLAVLTVPLGIFEGFTRYASILPGDAGAAMAQMNADARRMQDAFAQMATTMLTQEEAQPARQSELQGDQQRLQTTDAQASDSTSQLVEASQGAQDLQRANQQKLADATQAKTQAAEQKVELGDAAAQKTEQAQTLSAQLESWAPAHKGARDEAVHETEDRLQQEGYVVLPRSS